MVCGDLSWPKLALNKSGLCVPPLWVGCSEESAIENSEQNSRQSSIPWHAPCGAPDHDNDQGDRSRVPRRFSYPRTRWLIAQTTLNLRNETARTKQMSSND